MLKEETSTYSKHNKAYRKLKTNWVLTERTMKRIGEFSGRLKQFGDRLSALEVLTDKIKADVLDDFKNKEEA